MRPHATGEGGGGGGGGRDMNEFGYIPVITKSQTGV